AVGRAEQGEGALQHALDGVAGVLFGLGRGARVGTGDQAVDVGGQRQRPVGHGRGFVRHRGRVRHGGFGGRRHHDRRGRRRGRGGRRSRRSGGRDRHRDPGGDGGRAGEGAAGDRAGGGRRDRLHGEDRGGGTG